MPEGQLTIEQLGQQTKAKYPQYNEMSDADVGNAVLKKYPQYQSKITQPPAKTIPSGGLETASGEIVQAAPVTEKVSQETIVPPKQPTGEGQLATVKDIQLPELEGATHYAKLAMDFPELQQNQERLRDLNDGYGKTWQAVMDSKDYIRKQTPSLTSEKLSEDAGQFIANALDLPSYVGGNVEAMLHGLENTREGMSRMNPVSLVKDPKDYFSGTLQFLNGGAETFFGAAMNTPAGYVFTQGINAESTFGSGEATKIALAPLQSYAPKTDNELINEAYKTGDILWSLAVFHDLHKSVKGQPEKTLVAGIAERIRGGKEVKGEELINLTEAINQTANPENLSRLHQAAESLPKDIPAEKIPELTAKVAAIEPETMAKMPPTLHPAIKVEVAPMIEQKQKYQDEITQLETERVQLDDAFHPQVDSKIKYREGKVESLKEQIAETIKEKPTEKPREESVKTKEEIESKRADIGIESKSEIETEIENTNLAIEAAKLDENKMFEGVNLERLEEDLKVLQSDKPEEYFGRKIVELNDDMQHNLEVDKKYINSKEYKDVRSITDKFQEIYDDLTGNKEQVGDIESFKKPLKESVKVEEKVEPKIEESSPKSNKAISDAVERMNKDFPDALEHIAFNWGDVEVVREFGEKVKFKGYVGRDRQYSKGKEGGSHISSKKEFIEWLLSDEPLDAKKFDQDAEWRQNINDLRSVIKQPIPEPLKPLTNESEKAITSDEAEVLKEESKVDQTKVPQPELVSEQKYKIGKSPQTYTLIEKLKQTKDEKELGEQPVRVKNDKTGKEEVVLEADLTPIKQSTPKPQANVEDKAATQQDALVNRIKEYNGIPESHTKKRTSVMNTIKALASDLGVTLTTEKIGASDKRKLVAKTQEGKRVQKTKTQVAPEALEGKGLIDRDESFQQFYHRIKNDVASENTAVDSWKFDVGLSQNEINKAIRDLEAGKSNLNTVRLLDELESMHREGQLSFVSGSGLGKGRIGEKIDDYFEAKREKDADELQLEARIEEMTPDELKSLDAEIDRYRGVDGEVKWEEFKEAPFSEDLLNLIRNAEEPTSEKPQTGKDKGVEDIAPEKRDVSKHPDVIEHQKRIAEAEQKLRSAESARENKRNQLNKNVTLFDEGKRKDELFEVDKDQSPENIKRQLEPFDRDVANAKANLDTLTFELPLVESFARKQTEIPIEKKSGVKSAKERLQEAKKEQKKIYDEEGKLGVMNDPFKSARRKAEVDREVFDAYVSLAVEHVKEGITKVGDFAKSIGEEVSDIVKNAWANATGTLPDSQLKTALSIVKNSVKGGHITKEQAIADAAKYLESTRWFKQFGGEKQSESMTSFIADALKDTDLGELSTKDFRKVFSGIGKSLRKITSEKDFTESKEKVVGELIDYIKQNSQRFSEFDKRYFNGVLDNIKRAKTPISLGREVARFNTALEQFGFRDLYKNAYGLRRSAKKNAARDKFGGITPEIRKFLSVDPKDVPIDQLDRYIGHLEEIGKRAKEVNARIEDIRDFNRMMQEKLDKEVTTEEVREEKTEDPEFKAKVISEVTGRLRGEKFDTSNLTKDEMGLVQRLKELTRSDLDRLDTGQLQQLSVIASKLENGWLSNRVKLDILDKIDTQKQVEKIQKFAPQLFRSMDEVANIISDKQLGKTMSDTEFKDSLRKTGLNYIDKVLKTNNEIIYSNFIYPNEQAFTAIKLADGKIAHDLSGLIDKLKLPGTESILHGAKFREMNTKMDILAANRDWIANGGEGDFTKILLYGKDKKGNNHIDYAKLSSEDKLYIREQYDSLLKKFGDKNGELDLQKLESSLSPQEKAIMDYAKRVMDTDIKPKLYFSETYNRGGVFIPQEEYNPRVTRDQRVTAPTAEDMMSRMIDPESVRSAASSKAGSTIERTKAIRFRNFDFIGNFIETAHDAYTDYYLTPTAKKVFSGLTELEKNATRTDAGKIQGLQLVVKDAMLNIINQNFEKQTTADKFVNMASRIAINNMLTNAPRTIAEPASNMIGSMSVVGGEYMVKGIYEYGSDRTYWNNLLHEANSPILNRVGRYTAEIAPVFENEIYIPNHTAKGVNERVGKFLDALDKNTISEASKHIAAETLKFGDAVTILPTWTAAYIKSIEKQTGKPFSKEAKYDAETKQDAFAYADNVASQTHNVSSSFAQARVIHESRDKFSKAIGWFLRGFTLNDTNNLYFSGKDFWRGKSGGADVTRAQALQVMGGVVAKQIAYQGISKYLNGLLYGGITLGIGAIAKSIGTEDEEKTKRREEFAQEKFNESKEVLTARGVRQMALMQALQLATGRSNYGTLILANNIAEMVNKKAVGSTYDKSRDAISYSPEIVDKLMTGDFRQLSFYDFKQVMGNYGAVMERIGLTAEEAARIANKVAGDEELKGDDLIKWQTMNAMFFGMQSTLAIPYSGTIDRAMKNEQKIQDSKDDPFREANILYQEKYVGKDRDQVMAQLNVDRSAVAAQPKKTVKEKDAEIRQLERVLTVAERQAALTYNKEEKRMKSMGVDFPNEHGDVIDYLSKKTKDMKPAQRAEYLKGLYNKYIISFDTYGRVISETQAPNE